jgi:hypothetical protein
MFEELVFRLRTEVHVLRARRTKARVRRRYLADVRAGYPNLRKKYEATFGVPVDLENPRKFTEKMQWRKVHDRRPILRTLCDKRLATLWVEEKIGAEEARRWTIPPLFVVSRAADIPFDRLPESYVIKASHGSGFNIFVRKGGTNLDQREIQRRARLFLVREFGRHAHEWGYWGNRPVLIGEPLLANSDGTAPRDMKFHMFDGACAMIQCNVYGHATGTKTPEIQAKLFYSTDWQKMNIRGKQPASGDLDRPDQLSAMLDLAGRLSEGMDYLRVDFLMVDRRVFLGELTPYAHSGLSRFEPDGVDEWLGSLWTLPGHADLAEAPRHAPDRLPVTDVAAHTGGEPVRRVSGLAHRKTTPTDGST